MAETLKPVKWMGDSHEVLSGWDKGVRHTLGINLLKVQMGKEPSDWKAVKSVGKGARELRAHADNEHRVIYVDVRGDAIYVLHAFVKKSQKTAKRDIDKAAERYKQI